MSQIDQIFEKMAAQAKTAKSLVSQEGSERGSGLLTFNVGKGETGRTLFPVVQFGEDFTGYIDLPTVRLTQVSAVWQPMGSDNKPLNEDNGPWVRNDLIVRFDLRTAGEQIGRILKDGSDQPLPAYVLDDEAVVDWRKKVHTVEGRIWGADKSVISKLTFLLGETYHFGIEKHIPPHPNNPDGRETLFRMRTPTPLDVNGEPIYEKRGAPVSSFTIGLSPRRVDDEIKLYNDTAKNAPFLNFWCGTLQTTEKMLNEATGHDEDERKKTRGIMYQLGGWRMWQGNDGPVYSAKDVPFNLVSLGKNDYTPPKTTDSSFALKGGVDDGDKGISVEEMDEAYAKIMAEARGEAVAPAGAQNRFEDDDD